MLSMSFIYLSKYQRAFFKSSIPFFLLYRDTYLMTLAIHQLNSPSFAVIYSSGDIFISVERVVENASKYNVDVLDELRRVMIHGVLHFCG